MNHSDDFLFQHSKLGIAYVGLDGNCLKINDTMCNMLGYSHDELLNSSFHNIVHPDDIKESIGEFEQLLAGMTDHFTRIKRYICKFGTIIWVSNTLSIVRSKSNKPRFLIVQIQDITARKRTEVDLAEAEAFCQKLIKHALVGVYLSQEGKMVYTNPYLASIFGYSQIEILQRKGTDIIVKEDYAELVERARKTLNNDKSTLTFNIRGRKKDQSIIYLEGNCSVTTYKGKPAISGTIHDVTYKKKSEEMLLENAKRYQRILKYLPEPIIVHRDGIITYGNLAAVDLVKAKTDAEIIEKSVFDFTHPDNHAEVEMTIQQSMQTDEASNFEQRLIYSVTGEIIETEISSIRIDHYSDKPKILSVLRDITKRKKAEEILVRSEKLSVVGQLAAGVAHEIRNPLTSLMGFTQILKSKFTGQETYYFDIMQQELERINLIVTDFMTLAKPNLNEFKNGSIVEIFQSVISILETQAIMMNVNIKRSYMDEVPCISCDENQLKQVFMNIIKNAIEAMPDGGEVFISIKEDTSRRVHIQITDQGIGIPHSIIDKIGDPFFTTKENGTGLGLMISQRIIEAHNGSFHISSNGIKGTTVDVYLPILQTIE